MVELFEIVVRVNGQPVSARVPARLTLVDFLRHQLGMTGTHVGCEEGVCGACTVIVDGSTARACLMLAVQTDGQEVTTIEGLSPPTGLSTLQRCFKKHHALQCGFCTPGMITSAHALLTENVDPTRLEICEALAGNLCRCTGYVPIIDAVEEAASLLRATVAAKSVTATDPHPVAGGPSGPATA
jgi:carbon-monoxide dehydrogenase small subunit